MENASVEEKAYLPLVKTRIEEGNLSNLIRKAILKKEQKTNLQEAIIKVYLKLVDCLAENRMYS
jgi:predicted CopG family antitoxin